jgi:hypothetical protein
VRIAKKKWNEAELEESRQRSLEAARWLRELAEKGKAELDRRKAEREAGASPNP